MSAVLAGPRRAGPWRTALPLALALLALLLLAYRDTALAMVGIWSRSDTFAHAFLVLPISAWLVWRRRARLAALTPRPAPWLLLALAAAACAWLVGEIALVNAASQFALVAMLVLAVPALLGLAIARVIAFPLLFLFFAVPFGEFLLPVLMTSTADFTVWGLQMSGVPVYREGLQFIIPSGNWSVVEACSGVRYLIASVMVGTLFAYLNYRSLTKRLLFVGVSILVPVVANWVRAYIIVMLGHLSGNTIAVGVDHLIYGWVFFGIVIGLLYFVGARWADADMPEPVAPVAPVAPPASTLQPRARAALVATAAAVAVVALATQGVSQRLEPAASVAPVLVLPSALPGGWARQPAPAFDASPRFVNPSAEASASYAGPDGHAVGVHLAYYRGQRPDAKLVNSQNQFIVSDASWNLLASAPAPGGADGLPTTPRELQALGPHLQAGRRVQLTAWQLYWIDGRWVAGDAAAKAQTVLQRLRGHGDDGAVLVIHTDDDSPAAARARLASFATANFGAIDALLRRAQHATTP